MGRDAVIFDLDGTLIDSATDIAAVLNRMLAERGRPPVAAETVKPLVSLGAKDILRRVFGETESAAGDALMAEFQSTYRSIPADLSTVFPGVPELFRQLRAQKIAIGICTNKPEDNARRIVEQLGLAPLADALVGRRDGLPAKPDPAPLFETLRLMGGETGRMVYVGDNEVDSATARAARVPFVLVSFGYPTGRLADIACDACIGGFAELPGLLPSLMR